MRNVVLDGDQLKKDLIDYYGTAMICSSPLAVIELTRVENASGNELVDIAKKNGFDLEKYVIEEK